MPDPGDIREAQEAHNQAAAITAAERLERARAALGGFTPTDMIALAMIVMAVLLGFVGGWLYRPAVGFLVSSVELLVVGILAAMS